MFNQNLRIKIMLFLLLFLGSCAQKKIPVQTEVLPPEVKYVTEDQTQIEKGLAKEAIAKAEKDINEAVKAGAREHANQLLKDAEDMLSSAKSAFEKANYLESKKDAEKASELARKARSAALKEIEELKRLAKEEKKQAILEERRRAKLEKERLEQERLRAEKEYADKLAGEKEEQRLLEEQRINKELAKKRIILLLIVTIFVVVFIFVIRAIINKKNK